MSGFSHYRTPIELPEKSFVSTSNLITGSSSPSYPEHFNSNSNQINFPTSTNTPPDQDTSHPSHYPNTLQPAPADFYPSHSDHPPNIERHYLPLQPQHNSLNVVGPQGPPGRPNKPHAPALHDRALPVRLVHVHTYISYVTESVYQ